MYSKKVAVIASTTATLAQRLDVCRSHLSRHQIIQPALAKPVGADQSVDGHAVLSQPPGTLQCSGLRLYPLDRDVIAQGAQQRVDIAFHARAEKLDRQRVPAQLRDVLLEGMLDDRHQLGQPLGHPRSDFGDAAVDVDIRVATHFCHPVTVDPPGQPWLGTDTVPGCSQETTAAQSLVASPLWRNAANSYF